MTKIVFKTALVGLALLAATSFGAGPRESVDAFGAALVQGNADGLRAVLPSEGKVRVRLVHLGPQDGALRGGQLHAILQDFLERGSVQSFKLQTIEYSSTLALASAEVGLIDAKGTQAKVRLHLSFEPENDRWV
ncbi:MAG: hypothetical protein O7H39_14105, partial [Gammaproteobacteria bacterium]|nr:hypothetical protein [Gammaproteobacteria bacterium]